MGVILLSIIVVAVVVVKTIMSGTILGITALVAVPFIIYFVQHPDILLIATLLVDAGNLNVPGLWGNVTLAQLMQLAVIGIGIGTMAIRKSIRKVHEYSEAAMIAFLFVLVLTMYVRGSGLRFLGSGLWGGMGYITIIIAGGFYYFAPGLRLSQKQIKFLLISTIIAGFIPAFVQIAFVLSKGKFYILAYFIEAHLRYVAESVFSSRSGAITRYSSFRQIGIAMLPVAFVLRYRGVKRVIPVVVLLMSAVLVGLSGFRGGVLQMMMLTLLWLAISLRGKQRVLAALLAIVLAIILYSGLLMFSMSLPPSIQRAVSWMPGLRISPSVMADAMQSTEWRWQIWRYMLVDIPNYLWIGKGFCFPPAVMYTANPYDAATPYMAFLMHNYHNGPLSLILDLGIPGFVTALLFMVLMVIENFRGLRMIKNQDSLQARYYRYLTVVLLWLVIAFYFVFGDPRTSMVYMLITGATLRIIRYSIFMEQNKKAGDRGTERNPFPRRLMQSNF